MAFYGLTHKGKLVRKDGQLLLRVRFTPESPEIEVPLEEIFEDAEEFGAGGIEITIQPKPVDPPLHAGMTSNWTTMPEAAADPDYPFCSEEGRERFLDMKIGLMVHWGLYSHLGTLESWAAHARNAPSWFLDIYYTLWQVWNPTDFDAERWAQLVKRAGMQFIQVTTKHHEGFCLWDTRTTTKARERIGHQSNVVVYPVEDTEIAFSVMDTPFRRDVIKELSTAFRKHDLGFAIYYSHIDWNDPNFRWDAANRSYDPTYTPDDNPEEWAAFIERERQQLVELFTEYGPIDHVFFDGTWYGLAWDDMKRIVRELRALQPDCMFSDRGIGPYGDFTSPERWIPEDVAEKDPRVRERNKSIFQVCDTIGTHWSYVPGEVYKDREVLLRNVIDAVAKGGTIVLDAGPTPNGWFTQEVVDILEYLGRWLAVNGEAIYGTRLRLPYKEGDAVYFTRAKDGRVVYLIHVGWPYQQVQVTSVTPAPGSTITMLGVDAPLPWTHAGGTLTITIPPELNQQIPCEFAYAFKIPVE